MLFFKINVLLSLFSLVVALSSNSSSVVCPSDKILVYIDGHNSNIFCSSCVPGTTGISSILSPFDTVSKALIPTSDEIVHDISLLNKVSSFSCSISEFCDDLGVCRHFSHHPFIFSHCTSDDHCGGLFCVNFHCRPCPGVVSLSNSMGLNLVNYCRGHEYTKFYFLNSILSFVFDYSFLFVFLSCIFTAVTLWSCMSMTKFLPRLPPLLGLSEMEAESLGVSVLHVVKSKNE
ncbi:hypothetical protein RCL1_001687 [Eukaryota sp. TZLM3-RCL]